MTAIKMSYNAKMLEKPDNCIETAVGSWQKAQKHIQVANVSILIALYRHTDTDTAKRRINTLIDGVTGVNTTAIVEWFVQMGFKFDKDGVKGCPTKAEIKENAGENFLTAKNLHWWSLKAIKPYAGFDLVAKVHALVTAGDAAIKAGAEDEERASKDFIPSELLELLRNAA